MATTAWEIFSRSNADYDADYVGGGDPQFWEAYTSSSELAYSGPLATALEIASPAEVLQAFRMQNSVVLDVRPIAEVLRDGFVQTDQKDASKWVYMPCGLPEECHLFDKAASNFIPDRSSKYRFTIVELVECALY
mgnify:CR=1 FL=1